MDKESCYVGAMFAVKSRDDFASLTPLAAGADDDADARGHKIGVTFEIGDHTLAARVRSCLFVTGDLEAARAQFVKEAREAWREADGWCGHDAQFVAVPPEVLRAMLADTTPDGEGAAVPNASVT